MRRTFTGEAFPVPERTAAEVDRIAAELDRLAEDMDPLHPWEHPDAEELDRVTFADWLERRTDDQEARDNIALYVGPAMLTKPTHAFSALTAVLMAASAGSFSNLVDADFILDRRVVGGLHEVPLRLADGLGDDVRLSSPVTAVEWDDTGVTVSGDGVSGGPGTRCWPCRRPSSPGSRSRRPCRPPTSRCASSSPSAW